MSDPVCEAAWQGAFYGSALFGLLGLFVAIAPWIVRLYTNWRFVRAIRKGLVGQAYGPFGPMYPPSAKPIALSGMPIARCAVCRRLLPFHTESCSSDENPPCPACGYSHGKHSADCALDEMSEEKPA